MAIRYTTNHDEIRRWVEEHGGKPALVNGALDLVFVEPVSDNGLISWEEFFDIFENRQLRFSYDNETQKSPLRQVDAVWHYSFVDREDPIDGEEDETELPEDVDDIDENLFPSAP